MRVALIAFLLAVVPTLAFAQVEADQVDASILVNAKPSTFHFSTASGGGVLGTRSSGSLLGIDSVVNWSSYFYEPGVIDQFGDPQFTWQYTMVGHSPFSADGENEDAEGSLRSALPSSPSTSTCATLMARLVL